MFRSFGFIQSLSSMSDSFPILVSVSMKLLPQNALQYITRQYIFQDESNEVMLVLTS